MLNPINTQTQSYVNASPKVEGEDELRALVQEIIDYYSLNKEQKPFDNSKLILKDSYPRDFSAYIRF